jgi:hypothetical protein
LRFDLVANQYIYTWKADKGWANTCKRFVLALDDGTLHTADFMLK